MKLTKIVFQVPFLLIRFARLTVYPILGNYILRGICHYEGKRYKGFFVAGTEFRYFQGNQLFPYTLKWFYYRIQWHVLLIYLYFHQGI